MTNQPAPATAWSALKHLTPARVALGRAGGSLRTNSLLDLRLAHARARDALLRPLDEKKLLAALQQASGSPVLRLHTLATSLDTYLLRPDLGRQLAPESARELAELAPTPPDLLIIVSEGLSTAAAENHAAPLLNTLLPALRHDGWNRIGPVCLVRRGRVAVQDHAGECARASFALMLLGERPGLAAPDSLGAYLVRFPKRGNTDAQRNCISNIHARGLSPAEGGIRIAWLLSQARQCGTTGVQLTTEFPTNTLHLPRPASHPDAH